MRVFILFILALILLGSIFHFAGYLLVVRDDLERADLCHVLSGNEERVVFGIALHERGLCAKLVFIGGHEVAARSYSFQRRAFAIDRGVPADDIVIDETEVFSTFEEITRLAAIIERSSPPISTVMYVTDPYHTRRVRMVSRWILGDSVRVRTASVPFEDSLDDHPWWADRRSRQMVSKEYVKMIYYVLRYRVPFQPLNDWMVSFDEHR